jgi:hypothetical protein
MMNGRDEKGRGRGLFLGIITECVEGQNTTTKTSIRITGFRAQIWTGISRTRRKMLTTRPRRLVFYVLYTNSIAHMLIVWDMPDIEGAYCERPDDGGSKHLCHSSIRPSGLLRSPTIFS